MSKSNTQSVFKSKWMLLGLLAIAVVGALVFVSPDFGEDTSNMGGTMASDSPTDQAPEHGEHGDCDVKPESCLYGP